ncbi:MAG TPA: DUF5668 domain-containing protein [Bryobacteraceae bacterium]|nr:DUF5668 domain-containing protein [Bryobacteraceae bacterium]
MNGNNTSLARTIRGPITIITIGVLFALNNFTPYSFGKTWPVILIVFGLLSLLGRAEPADTPPVFPPPGYAQPPYPPQSAPPRPDNPSQPPPPPTGGYR